jgi:hypothetical protein
MVTGRGRIEQDVTDISSADQLLGYAAAGQLARLLRHRRDLSQGKIAHAAGLGGKRQDASAALSAALREGLTATQLVRLDEVIGALAPEMEYGGGLFSLGQRLALGRQHRSAGRPLAHVPPGWTRRIPEESAVGELGVLIRASALLSAFQAAGRVDPRGRSVAEVRQRYRDELPLLVRRLILVSAGPPTQRNYDAQVLLGGLASHAFDFMGQRLEYELRFLPLGFRVWPAITWLVQLCPREGEHAGALRSWVRQLIRDSGELRKTSLYAGRSLDLELAINIPAAWSPPGDDWAGAALLSRARDAEATLRERGTAAAGLWQRACREQQPDLDQAEASLRKLVAEFRSQEARPDIASGLRWVAATLEKNMDERLAVGSEWPAVDEPWFRRVQDAADELDASEIPAHLLTGTKNLFRHLLLQNAGVHRRQAIETLATSGWSEPVAKALGRLLKHEEETWLRVRAIFALGLLQRPDYSVEADLTSACLHAHANLAAASCKPPRAYVTEMHVSLFAAGDCLGAAGAEERARSARDSLRDVLTSLAAAEGDRALILRRAARAAAYLLIVSAQPAQTGRPDLSRELLERFAAHPDPVTSRLSRWALSFRFADDGTVRPLLAAVEHGM